jgi:AraC family transcriptional activator of pobA
MKKEANHPHIINSISELHHLLALPKPEHPLVSVINFNDVGHFSEESPDNIIINFYSIWIKRILRGK